MRDIVVLNLTDETFVAEVGKAEWCVVFFYANYSPYCLNFGPMFLRKATAYGKDVRFFQVDIEVGTKTAAMFDITAVPCLVLFKGGNRVDSALGQAKCEKFPDWLDKYVIP